MTTQLKLEKAIVRVADESGVKTLFEGSLTLEKGDFVSVIGTNGAGKSTLFNTLAGTLPLTSGSLSIAGNDVTNWSPQKRATLIARVFQDPKLGTAPRMTIAENLALARRRGKPFGWTLDRLKPHKESDLALLAQAGNGLEAALNRQTADLSGGQRQALSLLMATQQTPALLLLDEHTAALDPKTSVSVMNLTQKLVEAHALTTLMVTHSLEDALGVGNRIIVLNHGRIVADFSGEEKARLSRADLLPYFSNGGAAFGEA